MANVQTATVKLQLETDLTPVNSAFAQAEKIISASDISVKEFGADAKAAYLKAWQEANKYSKELKGAGESVKNLEKGNKVIATSTNRIKELRQEIKRLASDAIKLQEQGDIIGANESIKKAGQLKDELNDINDAIKVVSGNAQENLSKAFGDATRLAASGFEGATAAANLLGVESKDVEKQILRLQSLQSLSRITEEFGALDDRMRQIKNSLAPLREGLSNFLSAPIQGFKSLFLLIRANPIGAFIATVAALGTAFVLLKDKLNLFGEAEEARFKEGVKNSEETLNLLKKEYEYRIAIAEASGRTVSKLEEEAFKEQKKFLNDKLNEMERYRRKNGELSEEELEIEKKLFAEYEALLGSRNIAQAQRNRDRERLIKQHQDNLRQTEIDFIKDEEQREIAQARFKIDQEIEAFHESIKVLYDEEEQRAILAEIRKQKEQELGQQLEIIRKKYAERRLQLQKELEEALYNLSQKIEAENEEERIEKEKQAALRELAILKESIIKKGQAVNAGFKLNADQLEQFQIIERQIYNRATDELIKLEIERQNKIAEARLSTAEANARNLDTLQNADIQAVGATVRPEGVSEAQFEESKQRAILEIQRKYLAQRLELARTELNVKRDLQIKSLDGELAAIEGKEGEKYDAERAAIRERLRLAEEGYEADSALLESTFAAQGQEIENQIDKLNAKKPFSLAKLLGVDEASIAAIKTAFDSVVGSFSEILQLQIDKVDKEISASEKKQSTYESELKSLYSKLEQEKKLNRDGLNNNLDATQKEIALKEDQVRKEREIAAASIEDKKEIQKQQLLLDSISQASSLFTSATNIFAQSTASLGAAGVPVAIAAIAVMTGAFIASKLATLQAINEGNNYKDGVIDLQGPGTETSDSIKANLSKGESVMTAKETREHKDLLMGIRLKNKSLLQKGIFNLLPGLGMPDNMSSLIASKKDSLRMSEFNSYMSDFSALENKVDITNQKLEQMVAIGKEKMLIDSKGNLVIKRGNNTTTKTIG